MTNTTCNDARLMMSEALDGCLDEMRVSAVNEHVRTCAACRERWYALRHVSNLFHSAGLASPAPDFTLRVMQRLGRQQERERSVGTYGGRPLALAWAATSLLLVLPLAALALLAATGAPASGSSPLDFLTLSMRVSAAAIQAATITESVLGVAARILRILPPAVIALASVWLVAGTGGLALTLAGVVAGYRSVAVGSDES